MYSSVSVANRILELAEREKDTVTPMQLMKLVYLCHGWMLGLYGRHLVRDPIEAWRYGPVIKALYDVIRDYRSNPVNHPVGSDPTPSFDDLEENIIQQVYEKYGKFSGIQLSSLTHLEGSPWYETWNRKGINSVISNDLIEDYFNRLAREFTSRTPH